MAKRIDRKVRKFPKGTVIFAEGDESTCAYLVSTGHVEISRLNGGRKIVLATAQEKEMIGEMGIISDAPRSATAYCINDCELYVIDRDVFESKLRGADPFMQFLLEKFIENIKITSSKLSSSP